MLSVPRMSDCSANPVKARFFPINILRKANIPRPCYVASKRERKLDTRLRGHGGIRMRRGAREVTSR